MQGESGEFEEDDDSEDDTVNVVIGDIRTAPQYSSLNIKRGGLLTSTGIPPQLKARFFIGLILLPTVTFRKLKAIFWFEPLYYS